MIIDLSNVKIYIRPGHTDMRKAVNGLTTIVQDTMTLDPFSGTIYIFCSRERKLLKAVWWARTGFWLSQRRLEEEKYPWPKDEGEVRELTAQQLQMLLKGIDFFKAHKELYYKNV
jgi:transposase